jgi:hypothetical protein
MYLLTAFRKYFSIRGNIRNIFRIFRLQCVLWFNKSNPANKNYKPQAQVRIFFAGLSDKKRV